MRVAIDISQTVYGTGVSHYTEELVKSLLKIDSKNQYILFGTSFRLYPRLLNLKKQLQEFSNVSFKLIPLPLFVFQILWNKLHILPIEIIIGQIDLLHTSDWLEPPVREKTKKITTVHDMAVYLFSASVHPKIVANQKRKLDLVKKGTDLIIADSGATKEDLVKFLQIPQEKVKVVYLAASTEFKPQDENRVSEVLAKYKIKKPYILSVSTQEPRKNIQKLIDAFQKINQKNPEVSLVLVGKYGWGPTIKTDNDENVIYTGYVPRDDLTSLYSGCRVFAYPSLYEGFGLPILEAMAAGCPTITSNNSSMVEIAKDAAILVDPRSEDQIVKAIEMVLNLKLEDYQKMVNASLNRARQYSWARVAKQTLQIYRELVPKTSHTPKQKDDNEEPKPDAYIQIKQISQ